jgi:GYF domain 2
MNWFYAEGNRQNGPVSDSQLEELLRSGKISSSTLVWREGMSQWQPLNIARAGAQPDTVCIECGKAFPPDEIIRLNNSPVCAQCKPIFLQRMAENAPTPSVASLWRAKKRVVTRYGTVFPDRCVKYNAPAGGYRLKRTLSWVHPAFLFLILCNVLVLLIAYLIFRKKIVVHIGLCEHHRAKRKLGIIIGWSSVALGIALITCSAFINSGWCLAIGILTLLTGVITGGLMARALVPTKIDKGYAWLAGVHRDFLANLPEWRGP